MWLASKLDENTVVGVRRKVKEFESKRATIQDLLDKALADRKELGTKLHQTGVHQASDLKRNPSAAPLADALKGLVREIDSLQLRLAGRCQGSTPKKAIDSTS
jgi:hypothetical protein